MKITSIMHHISGTVWHMIMMFGALAWNDDSFMDLFHLFEILIFQGFSEVKVQKMAQNDKKFCLSRLISIVGTIHHTGVIYGTHV